MDTNLMNMPASDSPGMLDRLYELTGIRKKSVSGVTETAPPDMDALEPALQCKIEQIDAEDLAAPGSPHSPASLSLPLPRKKEQHVEEIVLEAERFGASDVHFEPYKDCLIVRYRIDGVLRDIMTIPVTRECSLITSIKVMANMDISRGKSAQDGRFQIRMDGRNIHVRVSSIPQFYDEKIVLRLFSQRLDLRNFSSLGFSGANRKSFESIISQPSGMVLISGPIGSGKTTTLYAALLHLRSEEKSIVSVEDPIELLFERINQIQVRPGSEFEYPAILRGLLRQDPDIIALGEIRDSETAQIAVQASLTGHLLLSTLHSGRVTAAISRLIDMGVMPGMLASALNGVVVQRLARRICHSCIIEAPEASRVLNGMTHFKGKGCRCCDDRGYSGRVPLHEILEMNDTVRDLINKGIRGKELFTRATRAGFKTIQEDALDKIGEGLITYDEAIRTIGEFDMLRLNYS